MRRPVRGFTLVELMIVVAIIGILASVGIPSFARAQFRAKKTERDTMMTSIARATQVFISTRSKFPSSPYPVGATWNPAVPPGTGKRALDVLSPGWRELELEVEGSVYYQYRFLGQNTNPMTLVVASQGDIDGDGVVSSRTTTYQFEESAMSLVPGGNVYSPADDSAF